MEDVEAVADRGGTPQASFIDAGLITPQALEAGLAEMRELAEDESVLALMPRMAQAWARKPGLSLVG